MGYAARLDGSRPVTIGRTINKTIAIAAKNVIDNMVDISQFDVADGIAGLDFQNFILKSFIVNFSTAKAIKITKPKPIIELNTIVTIIG